MIRDYLWHLWSLYRKITYPFRRTPPDAYTDAQWEAFFRDFLGMDPDDFFDKKGSRELRRKLSGGDLR